MAEIVNKVQKSGLIQLDLSDFKPKETIEMIDLKDNLWKGLALKEKDFREFIKTNDWEKYKGKAIGVFVLPMPSFPLGPICWSFRSYNKKEFLLLLEIK